MNRRDFVKYSVGTALCSSASFTKVAEAFGPLLFLRFLFSRAALRAFMRAPKPSLATARAATLRAGRLKTLRGYANPRKMYPGAPLIQAGVELGGITALSPELFKIVVNYNATTIWIMDDDKPEEFYISGKNNTEERISAPLVVAYNEKGVTGKPTEYYDHGKLSVDPYEHFSIKLSPPNELGGMRVVDLNGQLLGVDKSMIDFERSSPIVLANSWEVVK